MTLTTCSTVCYDMFEALIHFLNLVNPAPPLKAIAPLVWLAVWANARKNAQTMTNVMPWTQQPSVFSFWIPFKAHLENYITSAFVRHYIVLVVSSTWKKHMILHGDNTFWSSYHLMAYKGTWVSSLNNFFPIVPSKSNLPLQLPLFLNLKVSYKEVSLTPHNSF